MSTKRVMLLLLAGLIAVSLFTSIATIPVFGGLLVVFFVVAGVRARRNPEWGVALTAWFVSAACSYLFFRQVVMGDSAAAIFWMYVLSALSALVGYVLGRKVAGPRALIFACLFASLLSFAVVEAPELLYQWQHRPEIQGPTDGNGAAPIGGVT